MKKKAIKVGLAPTRRDVFSREDSMKYKKLIEKKLRDWKVKFVNINWLNDEGLLYSGAEAKEVAARFRAEDVDAVFAPHCNFGTEDAVAKLARDVGKPFLLWGPRDEAPESDGTRLRDTQCGLFATSKILRRLGVPFTYIVNSRVDSPVFERGFKNFLATAAATNAFLGARIGQVSPRPPGFWTVMVNEGELLERWGIEVVPTTLVEIVDAVEKKLATKPRKLKTTMTKFKKTASFGGLGDDVVAKLAALKLAIADWAEAEGLDGVAFQCWDALQVALDIVPCFVYGELTGEGLPLSCETDIHGAIVLVMLQAAAMNTTPPFFADLTVRHPDNDNAELLWHCGPFPSALAERPSSRRVGEHFILPAGCPGIGQWKIKGGDVTIGRFDGDNGRYSLLMGEAKGTKGPRTQGTYLWVEVKNWPKWEEKIIYGPYIHHVAGIHGRFAAVLHEACKYIPGLEPDPVEPTAEEISAYLRGDDLQ
jgi:L-fucose isomerase-like protein